MTAKTATKIVVSPFDHVREIDGVDRVMSDEIVCSRCGAHGAPDKCWSCGRRK